MSPSAFPARALRRAPDVAGLVTRLRHSSLSRRQAIVVAILLTLFVSLGAVVTTAQATSAVLYLVPIGVATWFHGRRCGVAIALLCTAASLVTDLYTGSPPMSPLYTTWNTASELLVFLALIWLLDLHHLRLEREQALRRASLDQLRHSERLNTIGRLASGVAHELGTPLNVISGRAELIQRRRVDPKESARIIGQQADRMAVIIRQLLDFSRRAGGSKERTNLRTLCEETVSLLQPLAKNRKVRIEVIGDDVEADLNRSEIQQVLSNLLTNAVQAVPRGGAVEIEVSREYVDSSVEDGHEPGIHAVLAVRDCGPGIPATILPRVFDPFFTTKAVGEGTGLGLSVSHGIVTDHGGWMRVDSRIGEGTTFFVYLPLSTH